MTKRKLLIFGSNGGLSSNIIKLIKKKFEIIRINKKILNFNEKQMHLKLIQILSKYNPDIIINSSGTLGANNLKYQEVFNTNFGSNWEIIKFYLNKKITKKIKIILIGSTSYNKISKNYLLYSASKAALHSLYKGSKKTLKERNISISIYHPKRMKTKMIKNLNFINKNAGVNPEIEAKNVIKLI